MMLLGFDRRDLHMTFSLLRMTLRDRFLGSGLGMIWAVANPLLMLAIFTFVFGFVFKAKLPGAETSLSYVIWLISGYAPWLAITEALSTGTNAVTANSGIVKNLPLKIELLPIVGVLTGLVPLAVGLAFLIVLLGADGVTPSLPWLIMPVGLLLQFALVAGLVLFLSAINVFIRDVAVVLPNALLLVLFASPIFYPLDIFPVWLRPFAQLNPFYAITETYRAPLIGHVLPPLWMLAYLALIAGGTLVAGLAFFRRLKSHFDSRL